MSFNFFNCSNGRSYDGLYRVPCLRGSESDVYSVAETLTPSYVQSLLFCTKIFNSSSITPALFDSRQGPIQLNWTKPTCRHCELEGKYCRLKNNGSIHDTECFPKEHVPGVSKKKMVEGVLISLLTMGFFFCALLHLYLQEEERG